MLMFAQVFFIANYFKITIPFTIDFYGFGEFTRKILKVM